MRVAVRAVFGPRSFWSFSTGLEFFVTQVISVIGVSMVVLAGLIWLPRWMIGAVGIGMIVGHNLLDGIQATAFGQLGWIWNFLHEPGLLRLAPGTQLYALYPLIPWAGVVAAGYALGPEFMRAPQARRRRFLALGAAVILAFIALRLTNLYGDPAPWLVQQTTGATVLSTLNVEKYPPSLLYLMVTLGPGLMLLAAFEHARGRLADWVTTFGRVPMLYYIAHIFLIHALAVAFAWAIQRDASWLFGSLASGKPAGYGLCLAGVYPIWLLVVVALYPLCRWFAAVKRHRNDWWLSYL
jgi:uncharacterized membrane protein